MPKLKIKSFNTEKNFGFLSDGSFFHGSVALKAGINKEQLIVGAEFEVELEPDSKNSTKNKVKFFKKVLLPSAPVTLDVIGMDKTKDINFSLWLNKPHRSLNLLKQENGEFKYENRIKEINTFPFLGVSLKNLIDRHLYNAKALLGENNVQTISMRPDWRLTIGIGNASVYETSITLHHIYGIPYIPASQIKGAVRSYIIQEEFKGKEENAIMDKDFCDVFGCSKEHEIQIGKGKKATKEKKDSWYGFIKDSNPDREGAVIFFDAFPASEIKLSLDIMNVHYSEYYRSESNKKDDGTYDKGSVKPPADWDNPSIINFLTIKGTSFQFIIGAKEPAYLEPKIKSKSIKAWLKEALEENGIGAKTAVGYGYFK